MSATNLKPYYILDAMKPDQNVANVGILDGGNNFIDTLIRQSVGTEPVLSFPSNGDSLQLIKSLQALEHQGWPLLSPKVQIQKCGKCAREFCSSINYRRHVRVHRRSLNIDKGFPKNREFLGVFWDKLSRDEVKEIVSFNNIALKGVSGPSILQTLTTYICMPGFTLLPDVYVKAGLALLDVVQARSSGFPISSEELFSILDDASEKTFLCAGTAISVQKFVFDGEIAKIGLEMKNIVAFTCFLLEQKLVKAWVADKDAEALRCQMLLMEEEETAQKRQAELFEKRRQKKLRRKEQQKANKQIDCEEAGFGKTSSEQLDRKEMSPEHIVKEADFGESSSNSLSGLPSVETSSSQAASNLSLYAQEESSHSVALQLLDTSGELDSGFLSRLNDLHLDTAPSNVESSDSRDVDQPFRKKNAFRQIQRASSSSQHGVSNEFHSSAFSKPGPHKDQKSTVVNRHKIWTPKTMPQNKPEDANVDGLGASMDLNARESSDQPDLINNCEVLIGSIAVIIRESDGRCVGATLHSRVDQCDAEEQSFPDKIVREKHAKPDSGQLKLWSPVNKHEAPVKDGEREQERERDSIDVMNIRVTDRASTKEICSPSVSTDINCGTVDSSAVVEDRPDSRGLQFFCSSSAEAFLTQRWKEAISSEHVMLVLPSEIEPPNDSDHQNEVSGPVNPNILRSSENRLSSAEPLEPVKPEVPKARAKTKSARTGRLKYIPKQRNLN